MVISQGAGSCLLRLLQEIASDEGTNVRPTDHLLEVKHLPLRRVCRGATTPRETRLLATLGYEPVFTHAK